MKIGFFDSGKGGTTVLAATKKLLPSEEYFYYGDSENCPYGEKTDDELNKIVYGIVKKLEDWGAEIIVVACNTATTRCMDYLKTEFPQISFVGTVPAIRLAAKSGAKNILVMATPGTIQSERVAKLVHDNKKTGQEITLLPCPGLADAIEHDEKIDETLEGLIGSIDKKYDVVVLGCTHYSIIKDKIQKYFPKAKLVDGNDGVARRIKEIIESKQ